MSLSLRQAVMKCIVYDFRAATSTFPVVYTSIACTAHIYAHRFTIMHAHTVHMYYTIHTWTHTYTLVVRNCIECRIWCQRDNLKIAKTGRKRKYQKDQELELGRWLVLPTNVQPHFTSSTHKKQGRAVQAHNPRAGEAETKGSIGLAGQPM